MSLKFTVTKAKIQHHFHYCWWQYVLLIALAIFGWNLLYTVTRYRPPEHLKVEWYYEGSCGFNTVEQMEQLMQDLTPELFPEMEETAFLTVGTDETYGPMQLSVWMAAAQGDLYTLSKKSFETYAAGNAMVDLQPYVDDGTLNVEGIDLKKGYVRNDETGEKHLYGIPAGSLTGLHEYELVPKDLYMCVLSNGGNVDNTVKFLGWLLENMQESK